MGEGDVRTMLLEGIGPFRKQLLDNDREKDGRVFNAFVANVARNANGLPLYVQLVIDDIATNKYVAFNGREQLPKSLEAYYEKLLARLSVGRLHMVLTPMVGLLAVAREALNPETLVVLLSRWVRIYTDDDPLALVQRALASTASMLRRTSTPEGEVAYTLSHQKLREHMDRSPEMKGVLVSAREVLSENRRAPRARQRSPAEAYLHRQGVVHLLENGRPSAGHRAAHRFRPSDATTEDRSRRRSRRERRLAVDYEFRRPRNHRPHLGSVLALARQPPRTGRRTLAGLAHPPATHRGPRRAGPHHAGSRGLA